MRKGYDTVKLGDIAEFSKGKGLPKSAIVANGRHKCVHYGELFTFYGDRINEVISRTDDLDAPALSVEGDILMPTSDVTPAGLAKACCIPESNVILGGDILVIRPDRKRVHPEFLSTYIRFKKKEVLRLAKGTTVFHLYGSDMAKLLVQLPPFAEQQRIAEILRTWDDAIEAAEAELKAKQERKRGLMLKCLAPAIEGKGANGWPTVTLGEICNPQQWTTISQSQMTATGVPVYGANSFIGFFDEANHENDVIAVSCRGSCGEVAFVKGPSYVTGNSMCLDDINNKLADIYWLYQCLKLRGFRDIISGSAQPQIIRKDVIKVKLSLPPLPAQIKSAEVLLSADHDIKTINYRIEALRTQKRGLMQKLLTGEVRVAA